MTPASDAPQDAGPTRPAAPHDGGRHTAFGRWLYTLLWVLCRVFAVSLLGFRVRFAERPPREGGVLVLSSHQSHLDPLLLGLSLDRRISSLARASLFAFGPFGRVITALDAIPIDREGSAVAAMKAVIARLKAGAAVIVFPEGTRTATGRLGVIKPGFAVLAKRSAVPILPVAIVGAFECWPRTALLPRPGRIRLEYGPIVTVEEVTALDDRALTAVCVERLERLDALARATRAGRPAETVSRSAPSGPA
jgi:1-acyl-sn-glycerol-3-phosphate acyltransferase